MAAMFASLMMLSPPNAAGGGCSPYDHGEAVDQRQRDPSARRARITAKPRPMGDGLDVREREGGGGLRVLYRERRRRPRLRLVFLWRQHLAALVHAGLQVDVMRAAELAGFLVLDVAVRLQRFMRAPHACARG